MPSLKIDDLKLLKTNYNNYPVFIETGTYMGETVMNMITHFETIMSCEVSTDIYAETKKTINSYATKQSEKITDLYLFNNSSTTILPIFLPVITDKAIIFLDAHYSGGNTEFDKEHVPINDELEIIMRDFKQECVVIIDDRRLFGMNDDGCDWTMVFEKNLDEIVWGRRYDKYYLPSELNSKDRLVYHLASMN